MGFPGQSPEVASGATDVSPMAGHPMAPTDRDTGRRPKTSGTTSSRLPASSFMQAASPAVVWRLWWVLINFACQVHSHLRVYLQTADSRSVPGPSPRQRHLSTHSLTSPPCPANLGRSQYLGTLSPPFQVTLPRLVLWTDASRSGWGALLHPPEAFSAILRWAGPLQVDLLASPTNLPSAAVGVSLPSPGCSGLQTVSVSTGTASPAFTRSLQSVLPLIRGYRGRLVLVAPWDPQAPWLPLLLQQARDHLHLRTTPYQFCGRGQVFHRLGTSFHRALLASRPAAVVDTLLASYRPSSQRQQEVAWDSLSSLVYPSTVSLVTKDDVLAFLQYLFSSRSLAPTTILNYRAALQWPLEEAFSVDFTHPDFFPICHWSVSTSALP